MHKGSIKVIIKVLILMREFPKLYPKDASKYKVIRRKDKIETDTWTFQ